MNKYIDVRGVWPVYVNGVIAIQLQGVINRGITVEDAEWIIENAHLLPQVTLS